MNILFVCTGNTCRSPMAEGYLRSLNIPDMSVSSAGISAMGEPVSKNSAKAMQEIGIDISSHISAPLTLDAVTQADTVYVMTAYHAQLIRTLISAVGIPEPDIRTLDTEDIIDPFGGDLSVYRRCRNQITEAIDKIFSAQKKEVIYLSEEDAKDIAKLEKLCFKNPWSESSILDSMKGKNTFMGIRENGQLTGYLSMYASLGEGYINNVATHPDCRRRGIARALLCELLDFCIKGEFEFITLEVRESNIPAISLYTAFGFKEEGRRKKYYSSPEEDAIILTRRF